MEISFYLHSKVSGIGTQSIYIDIAYGKEPCAPPIKARVQISTGVTVQTQKPNNWKGQEIKSAEEDYHNKNRKLAALKQKAGDLLMDYNRAGKTLNPKEFKDLLKDKAKGKELPAEPVILMDAKYYFERWAALNDDLSEKHIKDMRKQMDYFQEFAPGFLPEQITEEVVKDFRKYLIAKYDVLDVTLNKSTHMIKHVLETAGLNANHKWLKRKKAAGSEGVILEIEEQEMVRQWDPWKDENIKDKHPTQQRQALETYRDLMLFLINTGPRYTDFKNLKPHDVKTFALPNGNEIKVLQYYQIKNGKKRDKPCRVALNEEALSLIEKYKGKAEGKLFPVPSSQKLNEGIKTVCRLAGIVTPETIIMYQNGKRIEITTTIVKIKGKKVEVPLLKYHLVSCHKLRASFATNLDDGGAKPRTIQDALGHETFKSTVIYIRNKDKKQYSDMLNAQKNLKEKR